MALTTAVWGGRRSGKTSLSVGLSDELSRRGSVVLLFADLDAPALPVIFPTMKDGEIRSAGAALSAVELTEEKILESATVSKNSGILYLGYGPGENRYSYPSFGEGRAELFLTLLGRMADYVVIDCPSLVTGNPLAEQALKSADVRLRLYTPEISCFSFFDSQLPLLSAENYQSERQLRVLTETEREIFMPEAEAMSNMHHCDALLPYSRELRLSFAEGRLCGCNPGKKYSKARETLALRILESKTD